MILNRTQYLNFKNGYFYLVLSIQLQKLAKQHLIVYKKLSLSKGKLFQITTLVPKSGRVVAWPLYRIPTVLITRLS